MKNSKVSSDRLHEDRITYLSSCGYSEYANSSVDANYLISYGFKTTNNDKAYDSNTMYRASKKKITSIPPL
jgi:hypothetical protein